MNRFTPLALVMVTAPAFAQEYRSTTEQLVFSGIGNVIDAEYVLPFGANLDVIIAEFWVGVTVKLTGDAEFGLYVEGQSDVTWRTDDGRPGVLYHEIEPIPGSGLAAMRTDVGFSIVFDVWEGNYGSGSRLVTFPLLTQDIVFDLAGEPFTPFMLPGQTPSSSRINATSSDLAFDVNLGIPIGLGDFASIEIGTNLRGVPQTIADYGGKQLVTRFGTDVISAGGEIQLWEPAPKVDLISEYEAYVNALIQYVFNVDLYFEINVLGLFNFPITIPLFQQAFPLFSDAVDVQFPSKAYEHPLPMIAPVTPSIDFGEVEVGEVVQFTYAVNNDGLMELDGLVGTSGDPVFAASPPEVVAGPGGQDGIVVTFEPERVGEYTGYLILETNDPYTPYLEVPITGSAVKPGPGDGGPGDNPTDFYANPGSNLYSTCGCDTSGPTGSWALLGLVGLIGLRRRQG